MFIGGRIEPGGVMPFLIDGHNVIAAIDDIDLEDPDDEAKLVVRLRSWAARERRWVIVVFDGGLPGGPSRDLSTSQVQVIFASRLHTNADRIIRGRLRRLKDPGNWTVVTSDHEILDEARRVHARVVHATDFAAWLERVPPASAKPESISAAEVDAWLEVFGDGEVASSASESAPSISPSGSPRERPSVARPAGPRRKRSKSRDVVASSPRFTQTIGQQMGVPLPPRQEDSRAPAEEKPSEISQDEVNAWLQVFQDEPESHIPPPKVRKRRTSPPVRKPPAVRKDGELTPEEVEAWLQVFGDEIVGESEQEDVSGKGKRKGGTTRSKLARLKANLPDVDEEAERSDSLSDEDLALWRRLFGEGE